jgi:hypothetical protein
MNESDIDTTQKTNGRTSGPQFKLFNQTIWLTLGMLTLLGLGVGHERK